MHITLQAARHRKLEEDKASEIKELEAKVAEALTTADGSFEHARGSLQQLTSQQVAQLQVSIAVIMALLNCACRQA